MRTCVFGVCNKKYISHIVVSLLITKKYNKEYDYYVLTSDYDKKDIELCQNHGIKLLQIDLSKDFHTQWKYPRECFYHFKAPIIFKDLGYDYSIYIDGDIYCNRKIPLDISTVKGIAGTSYFTCKEMLYRIARNMNKLEKEKKFLQEKKDIKHIHTGVLIYNNKKLVDIKYYEKVLDLYNKTIKLGLSRVGGDDPMLATVLLIHKEIPKLYLNKNYNYVLKQKLFKECKKDYYTSQGNFIRNNVFYHLVRHKPWNIFKDNVFINYTYKYFYNRWIHSMIDLLSQNEIKQYYPQYYKKIKPIDKMNFFWFRKGKYNFGDWLLPYMIKKCSNISPKYTVPKLSKNKVLQGAGSTLHHSSKNSIVWGSGTMNAKQKVIQPYHILSVRGPLTKKRMNELKIECPENYGDSGLLLPLFYKNENIKKTYDLGIVPHISQYEKVKKVYEKNKKVNVIDLTHPNIEETIDEFLKCRYVASSSLHGLITADAYSIPCKWIKFDNNLVGDDTKFKDYLLSVNIKDFSYINAIKYKYINEKAIILSIKNRVNPKINIELMKTFGIFDFEKEDISIKKSILYMLS